MLPYSDDLGTLPPGFVFQPTDQQILKYYVRPAIETGYLPNFMTYCDLYTKEPWNLFDKNFAGYFWIYTPLKNKTIVCGQHMEKKPRRKKKKKEEINCEYIHRRAGCGYWDGRTAAKEIRDYNGKLLGRQKYFTYNNTDAKGLSGNNGKWVMHEYSLPEAEGLNNAALCKIQCKPSVKPKKRQGKGKTQRMSVNPTPQKKGRVDDHNEETKCNGDPNEFVRTILLENPSPPHVDEIEPQSHQDSLGQVADFTDTNPNDLETFGKPVDWDNLQVIGPMDTVGSDECSCSGGLVCLAGFDELDIIPSGFDDLDIEIESYGF
ncbi:No apical meristem (NAM) protein [Corchorus capsularis]|uniref:No apical meristem (NAM) protein n=1 Tax=Corchorus capsularis TaxID=210143 RepID=A0A1R3I219_COCAP|nr:No apical meristem (NAM) protein [Corchorus capsularis]